MPPTDILRRAPRPALDRDRIVAAAIARTDARGIDGLSMRALAGDLGVQAMSLYNHVRDKEDLVDGMVEAIIGRVTRPGADGDWRAGMRDRALSMRAVFTDHPWAPPLVAGRISVGPNMLGLIDATLGCLSAGGFTYAQADHVWNAVDSLIYGHHLLERVFPLAPQDYAQAATAYLPMIDERRLPHMHALSRLVAAGAHSGVTPFRLALDILLDGLEGWRLAGAPATG